METDDPAASAIPPFSLAFSTFAPSSSTTGVTLDAIMEQLQQMDARLDYLSNKMCQMNTWIWRIGGFGPSPSPFPEASADEDDDAGDEEDDASSSSDDKMTTSQWLALFHSWQKEEVVLGLRVVLYVKGELV